MAELPMTDTVGPVEALVAKLHDPPAWFTCDDADAEARKIDAQIRTLTEALEKTRRMLDGGRCELHDWWLSSCGPCGDNWLATVDEALRSVKEAQG